MEIDEDKVCRRVLLSMNRQFEVLAEVSIDDSITLPSGNNPTNHDGTVSVCWRPDGSLCAVSTVDHSDDNTRKIKIYQRNNLQYHAIGRTEDGSGKLISNLLSSSGDNHNNDVIIHGSGKLLAWAGTGCSLLLTTVQKKGKKKKQVIFLEPNGLRHGEFLLREEDPNFEV